MKISILMPTYNDASTITAAISSVINQTYQNWELIIVNDGSTDESEIVIDRAATTDKRIKYIYQENKDQLNALYTGSKYITGDYVTMFHSDDLLPSDDYYEKCIAYFKTNKNTEALIGDFKQINIHDNFVRDIKVSNYKVKNYIAPKMIINLGRNLYNDVFFAKKEIFEKYIINNYIVWNMPFWLYYNKGPKQIKVAKVPFPTLQYRIHQANYINNEIGQWNVVNGNLRTITSLIKYYDIPFFKIQFLISRVFAKLKISSFYIPFYKEREFINKDELIKKVIIARVGNSYIKNKYFTNLISFYKNTDNNRKILINYEVDNSDVYMGKDMRLFNKQILEDSLPLIYNDLITEMKLGFNTIEVKTKTNIEKLNIIVKFLNISEFVKVVIKK